MTRLASLIITALLGCKLAVAEQAGDYDYFSSNRAMIRNGVQAVLTCNGLFTSHRSIEQVFAQELAYLPLPVGNASGGNYRIDQARKAVAVGGGGGWYVSLAHSGIMKTTIPCWRCTP